MSTSISPAEVISEGGRSGTVESSGDGFRLTFQEPSETNPAGLTPEHLFGAAWAACYHGAVLHVAEQRKCPVTGSTVTAVVHRNGEQNSRPFAVELRVTLPGVDEDEARRITQRAHELCSYSRATRGQVDVTTTLN